MVQKKLPEPKPLFLERMKSLFKDKKDFKNYLEILKEEPARSLRCNTLKISTEKLKDKLEEKGWKIKQPFKDYPEIMIVQGKFSENKLSGYGMVVNEKSKPISKDKLTNENSFISSITKSSEQKRESNLIDLEPGELGRALEHMLGYYYIQELASMFPVIALKPKPGEKILDLCSAPGSKTTQIASEMKNTGTIIANEVSLGRIKILASNLERCGVMNTIITKKDGIALCRKLERENFKFDKILVDAPCSGEGTLRSSPKTYLMWNIKTVKKLSGLQKKLVSAAIDILKPKGEIIYSTCTHSPEENEEVISYILEKSKDEIKVETISLPKEIKPRLGIKRWQDKEYTEEVKYSCRIYPQDDNTEGFFLVKLKKIK